MMDTQPTITIDFDELETLSLRERKALALLLDALESTAEAFGVRMVFARPVELTVQHIEEKRSKNHGEN